MMVAFICMHRLCAYKEEYLAISLLLKCTCGRKMCLWLQEVLVVFECVKRREKGGRKLSLSSYYLFPKRNLFLIDITCTWI